MPDRRTFLRLLGATLFGTAARGATLFGAGATLFGAEDAHGPEMAPAADQLLALARTLPLDRQELPTVPEIASKGASTAAAEGLARDLFGDGGRRVTLDETRLALADRIRSDYAESRTEIVAGWVLSRTELGFLELVVALAASGAPVSSSGPSPRRDG